MSKLEEMLKYVSEHNEFYKNRIKEYGIKDPLDINQWPILTRRALPENRYKLFSDGDKSGYFNQQLHRQSSSGSSGIPVNVYWDYKDWYASNMSIWRKRWEWYNVSPNDKCIKFTLNSFDIQKDDKIYYIEENKHTLLINLSLIQAKNGFKKIVKLINTFNPKWLYIQPSVLKNILNTYKEMKEIPPKSLEYIESVGELLPFGLRETATEFFNVKLANMYGSEEVNGIAYECRHHHMHVLEDNVYLEILTKSSIARPGEGEIIVTNLKNKAMPLIRYNLGDQIVLSEYTKNCCCGFPTQIVEVIKGRTCDSINLKDGSKITSYLLLEIMAEVNNEFRDIIVQYSFLYK